MARARISRSDRLWKFLIGPSFAHALARYAPEPAPAADLLHRITAMVTKRRPPARHPGAASVHRRHRGGLRVAISLALLRRTQHRCASASRAGRRELTPYPRDGNFRDAAQPDRRARENPP